MGKMDHNHGGHDTGATSHLGQSNPHDSQAGVVALRSRISEPELSEAEAADRLKMHVKTLERLRRAHKIRHMKRGRKAVYVQSYIDEYNAGTVVAPCQTSTAQPSGSTKSPGQTTGTYSGTTPHLDEHAVKELARQTRRALKSNSRNMS